MAAIQRHLGCTPSRPVTHVAYMQGTAGYTSRNHRLCSPPANVTLLRRSKTHRTSLHITIWHKTPLRTEHAEGLGSREAHATAPLWVIPPLRHSFTVALLLYERSSQRSPKVEVKLQLLSLCVAPAA